MYILTSFKPTFTDADGLFKREALFIPGVCGVYHMNDITGNISVVHTEQASEQLGNLAAEKSITAVSSQIYNNDKDQAIKDAISRFR